MSKSNPTLLLCSSARPLLVPRLEPGNADPKALPSLVRREPHAMGSQPETGNQGSECKNLYHKITFATRPQAPAWKRRSEGSAFLIEAEPHRIGSQPETRNQ